jgi:hypothetical protein
MLTLGDMEINLTVIDPVTDTMLTRSELSITMLREVVKLKRANTDLMFGTEILDGSIRIDRIVVMIGVIIVEMAIERSKTVNGGIIETGIFVKTGIKAEHRPEVRINLR